MNNQNPNPDLSAPLVSVLMTAYNREKYIAEAIESVINSNYRNWELIVSDDCSTDSTAQIARKYAELDERIKVISNDKNVGDYNNRNIAASYALGKYLKYLDSDDVIYPFTLSIMVYHMENYPQAAYAFSDRFIQDDFAPFPILYNPIQAYKSQFSSPGGFFYAGPGGTIFRKTCFDECGGFSGKRYFGDTELLMKMSLKFTALKINPGLIWWRQHMGQEIVNERKDLTIIAARYNLVNQYINLSPLDEKEKNEAKNSLDKFLARKILKNFATIKNFSNGLSLISESNFKYTKLIHAFNIKNFLKRKIWNRSF